MYLDFNMESLALSRFDMKKIKNIDFCLVIGGEINEKIYLIKDIIQQNKNIPLIISDNCEKYTKSELFGSKYSEKIIDRFIESQRDGFKNPQFFTLVIDQINSNVWNKDINIKEIFFNHRFYKISPIITIKDPRELSPVFRPCIDFLFIFSTPDETKRRTLYEKYCGIFPSYEIFEKVLEEYTKDGGCLVLVNNNVQKN